MQFSKKELDTLKQIIKKIEENKHKEKIRISVRRKSQKKGKTINKGISKRKKPIRSMRRQSKKRVSVR